MSEARQFWAWCYHIARKWKPPPGVNAPKAIGFALIMATFGTDGRGIWPSAATLAECAHVSLSTANRLRKECVTLGLFRETGITANGIAILDISIPPDYGDHGDDCTCSPPCIRRYMAARAPEGAITYRPEGGQS